MPLSNRNNNFARQKANVATHVIYVTARGSVTRLVKLASFSFLSRAREKTTCQFLWLSCHLFSRMTIKVLRGGKTIMNLVMWRNAVSLVQLTNTVWASYEQKGKAVSVTICVFIMFILCFCIFIIFHHHLPYLHLYYYYCH